MVTKRKVIVFDLDDTLYKEIEFLKSGFRAIIKAVSKDFSVRLDFNEIYKLYEEKKNVFDTIIEQNYSDKITKKYLLDRYRNHFPDIRLDNSVMKFLERLKNRDAILGIITDGRSVTQRNKLKALGILDLFDDIIISEESGSNKLSEENYFYYVSKYPDCKYYYVGDNVRKDFVIPSKLNWQTFGIRDYKFLNIHPQNIDVPVGYLPDKWVDSVDLLIL